MPLIILMTVVVVIGFTGALHAEQVSSTVDDNSTAGLLRAGAAAVDINPTHYPVHVLGLMNDRVGSALLDNLYSRAIVLDNGTERLAIVVVDSTMLPRDLLDRTKELASAKTGIRTNHMLISATHTHSAPAAMALLGTPEDEAYVRLLPGKIARSIELAASHLEPARVGWTVIEDSEHVHMRRAIARPDRIGINPWGERTDRALETAFSPEDVTGPSGPTDPALSVVAVQSLTGRPIALLANYGNHFYGVPELRDHSPLISADYFGLFAQMIEQLVQTGRIQTASPLGFLPIKPLADVRYPPFVGIMSQGTSGDQNRRDFSSQNWQDFNRAPPLASIEDYSKAIAREVYQAYQSIEYHERVPLVMAESKLTLSFRTPDATRLAWARKVIADAYGGRPTNVDYAEDDGGTALSYAYAVQQIYLHEHPTAELKLQAIRIGAMGVTAIPNEVYALSGLKIKAQSPLQPTVNIELANGAEGYVPPPEQHALGGYTTWPASSSGLEVQAEPKIVEAVLALLERVSGRARRPLSDANGTYAMNVLASTPIAYWRLNEMAGPVARDATNGHHDANYEPGVVFYLPGPDSPAFSGRAINRAPHLAGGRIVADVRVPERHYSVELWFWNGLPTTVRGITGWLFSDGAATSLGIGGTHGSAGQLILTSDRMVPVAGKTVIGEKTWNYVVLVREGSKVEVYLNGQERAEISASLKISEQIQSEHLYLGGRADPQETFEGKIDEVAVYDRALSQLEIADHYRLSGMAEKR